MEPRTASDSFLHPWRSRLRVLVEAVLAEWPAVDKGLYLVFTTLATAFLAATFVGAMLDQTGGEWSAPLDDVFIHFDYARSTARGYPFQWSEGNGYSSGNTSLSYPFILAFGYWIGFRKQLLMAWAVLVACLSLILFFAATARLAAPLGRWAKYVVPPVVLSLGALDWSFFSGMENAFHIGVWAASTLALERLVERRDASRFVGPAIALGAANVLLVLTRPESVICVACFSIAAAVLHRKQGFLRAFRSLALAGAPAAAALAAQSAANRALTGEWSQAGAIAKLALHHPYMSSADKWDDWVFHFKYVIFRMTEHHFADAKYWGYLVPAVAVLALLDRRVAWRAALLWIQALGWFAIVALNGQVRWQNERYAMSGVAWLLVLAAMGLVVLVGRFGETLRGRVVWGARLAVAGLVVVLFWHHQRPNFRDQVWFFARASRNIRDQHLVAGRFLRDMEARRVLVGDAGALMYASDLPGLDIIGLGGYKDYPFARATKYGLGGALELIERMPDDERPDVMAIYPSWWGDLPIFGTYVKEFPVFGNVICGGAAKVLYRADWSALDRVGLPRTIREGERVVDSVDVGDLMSEKPANYLHPKPGGYLVWRVLPSPSDPKRDLFDAGRIIAGGRTEEMTMAFPRGGGRLVLRTVASKPALVRARIGADAIGEAKIEPGSTWQEVSIDLPVNTPERGRLVLEAAEGEWVDYHVWTLE